jgi:phage-related protein
MAEKPVIWVGSSREDLRQFPEGARREAGYQLRRIQVGLMPDDWKVVSTVGSGVYGIRIHAGTEHRVLHTAKFEEAVSVLHAFEKRTRQTRQADIEIARRRLADVRHSRQV